MKEITGLAGTWNSAYVIKDISHFMTLTRGMAFAIFMGVLVLHLIISSLIIQAHTRTGRARTFMRGIYTIVCAPLFVDWEEIFRSVYNVEKELQGDDDHGCKPGVNSRKD